MHRAPTNQVGRDCNLNSHRGGSRPHGSFLAVRAFATKFPISGKHAQGINSNGIPPPMSSISNLPFQSIAKVISPSVFVDREIRYIRLRYPLHPFVFLH
jgi:hypothetical protein